MKATKEQKIVRHFKRVSRFGRFIKKHVNKNIGRMIQDWNDDMLNKHYYGR